jgi:RNA-directed DNA polymerase
MIVKGRSAAHRVCRACSTTWGCKFRYADDVNIYVRSERAGQRVMGSIKRFMTKKLKLRLNDEKSAVAKSSTRKFLGFSFTDEVMPRRHLSPQSITRFRERIRKLTGRHGGLSVEEVVRKLRSYLRGWLGYYSFVEVTWELQSLESWVRRRLRCLMWTQWKTSGQRFRELRRRGVGANHARRMAGSSKGSWHLSRTLALSVALPNVYFSKLGIPPFTRCGVA